ncbi:MAG: FimV/HubP family polar landmark protein, partial [Shewanella sp.]
MKFRTSYLVGLMVSVLAVSSTTYFVYPAVAADAPQIKPLKIMGPDGQIRQVNHQYGPTTAKDTFWSIAQKVRPDASVSVYQVMAALFDANPHAFYSNSYNSLERGMILLIPSKEVMQAIPNSVAIARAKRVDKQVRTVANPSSVKPAKPINTNPPSTQLANNRANTVATASVNTPVPSAPTEPPKVQTISPSQDAAKPNLTQSVAAPSSATSVGSTIAATSSVSTQNSAAEAVNQSSPDVNQLLEAAQSKTLALTDELARTQDQLTVRNADVKALQAKVDELNQKIAVLEETLMMSKQQNQALTLELAAAQSAQTAPTLLEDTPADVDDMWRKLMNNPLLLVAAAVAPALVMLLLVYWLLRRKRNKEHLQLAAQQTAMALGGAAGAGSVFATDEDTLGAMAVQLADDQPDSIDSLLDIRSVDLQLEQDISDSHEQMDMAGEMFIDPGTRAAMDELEGQSLDELWAEAMGEQAQDLAAVNEPQVELSSLSPDVPAKRTAVETASKLEDEDFDALLAGVTLPVNAADADKAQAASANAVSKSEVVSASVEEIAPTSPVPFTENDTVDANLIDENLAAEIDAALAGELDSLGVAQPNDDIDALLAAFEQPAAPDTTLADEIAAELDSELDDIDSGDLDDIDALLASFNAPTPTAEPQVNHAAPLSTVDDDLDALLAEFNINPDVVHPVNVAEDGATEDSATEESATDDRFTDSFAANIADETARADGLADEVDAERINTLPEELDPRDIDPRDSELDALLAEFEVPEQLDADADDANFDIETAHIDARNVDPVDDFTFAGEDELLKGIGAGHAIDGTDDTFTLNDN